MRACAIASFAGLLLVAPAAAQAPQYLHHWPAPGEPWAITIGSDGNLWVSLAVAGVVRKYSPDGQLLFTLGAPGTGPGQFNAPLGVAFTPDGDLFVADHWNDRVQRFSPSGTYVSEWSTKNYATDEHPAFIAWHPGWYTGQGLLYITNSSLSVWFFTPSGDSWGERQMPYPTLYGLRGLALDASGNLYVAASVGAHVGKLPPWPHNGLTTWPTGNSPSQLALDGAGRVWVTNYDGHEVRVYSTTGIYLFSLGGYGTEPGRFFGPAGIAIGLDGNIYVADRRNNRVQVFGYVTPTRPGTWGELKGRYR